MRHTSRLLITALTASLGLGALASPSQAVDWKNGRTAAKRVMAASTTPWTPGLRPSTSTAPGSIDATGGTDVTQELTEWLSSLPTGTTAKLLPGRYRIDGTVLLKGKRGLTLDGAGATLFAVTEGDRGRRHISFHGGSDVRVTNVTVRGVNPHAGIGELAYRADREAQHGFEFLGVEGVQVDSTQVHDVYGDFVYLGPLSATPTTRVRVTQNYFDRNGRQGIALTHAADVLIDRNRIENTRRATIDLEPNAANQSVRNVRVVDNQIGRGRLMFIAAHGAGPVDAVTVERNALTGRTMWSSVKGPDGTPRRSGFVFRGNTADQWFGSPTGAVIVFDHTDDIVFEGNTQPLQPGRNMVAVRLDDGCSLQTSGNTLVNSVGIARFGDPTCTGSRVR